MHRPAESTEPCNWYCHRVTTGGRQHEPAEVLHGTDAGSAAATSAADPFAGMADTAPAGVTAMVTVKSIPEASDPKMRMRPIHGLPVTGQGAGHSAPRTEAVRHRLERIIATME